ncbi:MAG: sortase [Clostridia bacterium]|nr:sortase [Clostridia bacterium]
MTASKYSKFLSIVLIVLISAIVIGVGLLLWNYVIKPNRDSEQKIEAIEEFDRNIESTEGEKKEEEPQEELNVEAAQPSENQGGTKVREKTYYKGFVMLGYITIPKTNVKEPILDTVTPETLNAAVAVLYPSNPQINEPGNVVIIGHNYKNGQFFSNNKKLSVGDKLQIKDNSGRELTYTIYKKFETTETDTSFYNRDTNGAVEVTLSTCTDDAKARTIILARVEG